MSEPAVNGSAQSAFVPQAAFGDVVVASQARLARAYDDLPFISEEQTEAARAVEKRVCGAVAGEDAGYVLLTLRDMSPLGAKELRERGVVSREWLRREKTGALLVGRQGSPWILLNEDDPVRICAAVAGLAPEAAYSRASELEARLSERTPFARGDAFGYLTARPEDAGTGLRAAVLLHLPMIVREEALDDRARAIQRQGLTFQALADDEGQPVCDLYAISTPTAFDRTVEQALNGVAAAARETALDERARRVKALSDDPLSFRNTVYRSLGALRYALRMDAREFDAHWSNLRLGLAARVLPGRLDAWDAWLPRMQNAHVLRANGVKDGETNAARNGEANAANDAETNAARDGKTGAGSGSVDALRGAQLRAAMAMFADVPAP